MVGLEMSPSMVAAQSLIPTSGEPNSTSGTIADGYNPVGEALPRGRAVGECEALAVCGTRSAGGCNSDNSPRGEVLSGGAAPTGHDVRTYDGRNPARVAVP